MALGNNTYAKTMALASKTCRAKRHLESSTSVMDTDTSMHSVKVIEEKERPLGNNTDTKNNATCKAVSTEHSVRSAEEMWRTREQHLCRNNGSRVEDMPRKHRLESSTSVMDTNTSIQL